MPWKPTPNELVHTPYGEGHIRHVLGNRILVRIPELNNLDLNCSLGEISPVNEPSPIVLDKPPPVALDEPVSTGLENADEQSARQTGRGVLALEALRFGVVPPLTLEELTIGYTRLKKWIARHLPHNNGGRQKVAEVVGPFGTGKSHAMAVIRHVALEANYVTSRVEVDGQQISLSNPEKLLGEIWRHLEIPEHPTTTPLLDLYVKAIQAQMPPPHVAPSGIDRVHDNYLAIREMKRTDLLDEYEVQLNAIISCSNEFRASEIQREIARRANVSWDFKIRPALARRVVDRPWDFLQSLVGHAAVAQLAGYKGLVVTIDEFEVEHNVNYEMWERVQQLVAVLRDYFLDLLDHKSTPLAVFFASVPQDANKGDEIIDNMVESAEGAMYELKPFSRAQRRHLAHRIHDVYRSAYDLDGVFDAKLAESVELDIDGTGYDDSGQIRAFIKKYIAELDWRYGPPNVRSGM